MRIIKTIRKKLVKKIIQKLYQYSSQNVDDLYEDYDEENMTDAELDELDRKMDEKKIEMKDKYVKFWDEFGKSIKAGIVEDVPNRKQLSEITRFYSTFNETNTLTSFEEYLERKQEN